MGLPIALKTDRTWLSELFQIRYIGAIAVFAIATVPALFSLGVFEVMRGTCWVFGLRNPATEDLALAVGLLASAPWNVVLLRWRIRISVLWIPMWLFSALLGTFGVLLARA